MSDRSKTIADNWNIMNNSLEEILEQHGKPIFRVTPERNEKDYETPDECIVFPIAGHFPAGLIVYSRYGDRWVANSGERYVIRELLKK